MKEPPTIEVEIDENGNVQVEVFHVQGPACQALTKDLEQALGKVTSTKKKAEFSALGASTQHKQQIGGSP